MPVGGCPVPQTNLNIDPATTVKKPATVGRRYWTVNEIAPIMGVRPNAVRNWIATQKLPVMIVTHKTVRGRYKTPSTTIRIPADRFDEWCRRRTSGR